LAFSILAVVRLGESWDQAISSGLTLFFFGLTALAFFIFSALILNARGAPNRIRVLLASYRHNVSLGVSGRVPTAPDPRDRIGSLVHAAIEEFDRRLITRRGRPVARGLSGQEVLDPERILQEIDVLRKIPYEVVRLGPSVLTALGLLGTFFGITDGLGAIGDVQAQGTSGIMPIISDVVKGLSTAFWTSIVGVVSGVLIMWWSRTTEHEVDIAVEQAVETLDGLFPLVTPEQLSKRAQKIARLKLREAHRQSNEMNTQSGQLARIELANGTSSQSLVAIGDHVQKSTANSDALLQLMRRLTEDTEESRSLLQQLIDDLGKTFTAAFERTMTPQLERMVQVIQEQVGNVASSGSDTAKQFAADLFATVGRDLSATFSSMATSVGDFRDDFEQMMVRVENSASNQAAVVQAGLEATERAQQVALAAGREVERLEDAIGGTAQVLTKIAAVGGNFSELVAGVGRAGEVYQTAAVGLGDFAREFANHAGRLNQTVAGLGQVLADATQRLDVTLGTLDARIEAEQRLADQYASTGAAVRTVVDQAAPVFQYVSQSASSLGQVALTLKNLAGSLTNTPDRVLEVTEALNQSSTKLQEASGAVSDVSKSIGEWRNEATGAINDFHVGLVNSVKDSLALYDASLSTAVSSIGGALEDLEEMLTELRRRQDGPQPSVSI
jgi:methyl-accepting chemotaxis protein